MSRIADALYEREEQAARMLAAGWIDVNEFDDIVDEYCFYSEH